jgi:hypothetical protein
MPAMHGNLMTTTQEKPAMATIERLLQHRERYNSIGRHKRDTVAASLGLYYGATRAAQLQRLQDYEKGAWSVLFSGFLRQVNNES